MWVTTLSIRRPLLVLVVVAALAVVGVLSYARLPVDLLPNATFPYVTVSIEYPGAGPREVESQVTKPVEDALAGINGLKHIASTSSDNLSLVFLEFNDGVDPDNAERDVQLKLNPVLSTLPPGTKTPDIAKFDPSSAPGWDLALTGDRPPDQMYQLTKDTIVPRLEAVDGVAAVTITGGLQREVRVRVDASKLGARGLSIADVESALQGTNIAVPAGALHVGSRDYELRLYALAQRVQDLGNLPIKSLPHGGVLRLADVAAVGLGYKDPTYVTRVDGREGVGLLIQKQQGANTVAVAAGIRKVVTSLAPSLPAGVEIVTVYDQSEFVQQSLDGVNANLREAIIITGVVLLLFLHTWRSTAIVLLAIPTSLVATFAVMHVLGFSLDLMSTMGLALTIGILVDDSIVILENISRHMHRGEPPKEAALRGRGEIGAAAVAITLVDVVVYAPMGFMTGVVGQFFKEFGITIVIATLLSLAVSFTLTPMLAAFWISPEREARSRFRLVWRAWEAGYERVARGYQGALARALRHRWFVVLGAALVFAGGLALAGSGTIGSEFVPESDEGAFTVSVDLPPGTSLDETNRQMGVLESQVLKLPEVQAVLTAVGIGGQYDRPQKWSAKMSVRLSPKTQRSKSVWQVAGEVHQLASSIPSMRVRANLPSVVGTTSQPIIVDVKGQDLDAVTSQAARVEEAVRRVPGTSDVSTTGSAGPPELRVVVDPAKAATLGVVPSSLGAVLRASYQGDTVTQLRPEGQDPLDIEVSLPASATQDPSTLGSQLVPSTDGTMVRLDQVATVVPVAGPSEINRLDRQFDVQIGANLDGRDLGSVSRDIQRAVDALHLPPSVAVSYNGDTQQQSEGFATLGIALGLSILLMYLLMVALYNSLTYPLVVMFSLPVASVGAFLALAITGDTFNIMSLVGIIMLTGLVAKNAILLVDYTNTLRGRGEAREEALLEAGYTRLRPIAMTTAAMVFAMLPLAVNLEVGSETRSSMAVVVIGGLLTSTLLTLFVVPAGYTLMDDFQEWVLSRFRGRPRAALPSATGVATEAPLPSDGTRADGPTSRGEPAPSRHGRIVVGGGSGEA